MAQSYTAGSGVIVDARFCVKHPVELAIVRKVMKFKAGNFAITDVNGDLLFKVNDRLFGLHDKRILLDGSGSPVLTLREKIRTMHNRWKVFRGGSTEESDHLYTVKKKSMVQFFDTKLDVFFSHNKEEKTPDFRVECESSAYVVYTGESDTILAQYREEADANTTMNKKHTAQSVLYGKHQFLVTVNPDVDYAFIASLIVILDYVNGPDPTVLGVTSSLLGNF
ncbi:protein LURP-one-related 15 isoform X1 [Eutrema salsugineum]|uniref:protein LURP-one-related 15 isoform X1 n=1 Tax=Eutrema salsugineum TaxID=72664 RepID=UPI000CED2736|nr:protein LURP-one-related 15 isoform X1 [Eutrema salsugineum]